MMISDNAKVFKAASSVIKKVVRAEDIKKYMLNNQISLLRRLLGGGDFGSTSLEVLKGA